jgi:hypothetical protein
VSHGKPRGKLPSLDELDKNVHRHGPRVTYETSTPPTERRLQRAWWRVSLLVATHALIAAAAVFGTTLAENCLAHHPP